MLQDECIALCRGVANLPIFSNWSIEEDERTQNFESNSEWIVNYRSLVIRFEKRRKGSQGRASHKVYLLPSAELHAICADRIAAIISYLEKLEPRNFERCWSESRPYLSLSSRQDREMGRSAKHYLFTDAQKIWTLDALLSEEEAENLLKEEDEQEETVLAQWKSKFRMPSYGSWTCGLMHIIETILGMSTRCSEEVQSSLASSALLNEPLTRGSNTGVPCVDTSRLKRFVPSQFNIS